MRLHRYIIIVLFTFVMSCGNNLNFDSKSWLNEPYLRISMLNDIIGSSMLLGLKKIEVDSILGPPTWIKTRNEIDVQPVNFVNEKSEYVYGYLCFSENKNVQSVLLRVEFDILDNVVASWTYKD